MASNNKNTSSNNTPNRSPHASLQNWHESFSLLDDDEDEESIEDVFRDEDQNLRGANARPNENHNRSFVDFLFDQNSKNDNNNNNDSFTMMPMEDEGLPVRPSQEGAASFSPLAQHPVVNPASLSDSFIKRSFPTASVLASVEESQELDDSLHAGASTSKEAIPAPFGTTAKKKATSNRLYNSMSSLRSSTSEKSSKSTGTDSKRRKSSRSKTDEVSSSTKSSGKRSKPRKHKHRDKDKHHSSSASKKSSSMTASAPDLAYSHSKPPSRSRSNNSSDSGSLEDFLNAPPTGPPKIPAAFQVSDDDDEEEEEMELDLDFDLNANIDRQAIMEMSMNLSQVFDPELQRLENTMPPPPPRRKKKPTPPTDTTTNDEEEKPSKMRTKANLAAFKAAVPTAAAGVAALRVITQAVADTEAAKKRTSDNPQPDATTAAATTAAATTAKRSSKATKAAKKTKSAVPTDAAKQKSTSEPSDEKTEAEKQRELWQQSMANDFLAVMQQPDEYDNDNDHADTNGNNKDRSAGTGDNKGNNNNDGLSETVHNPIDDEDDDDDDKDDTCSYVSDSYHEEEMDKRESAEAREAAVQKSLFWVLCVNFLGMMAMTKLIDYCCRCCQKNDDDIEAAGADLAGEAAQANNQAVGGGAAPPGGGNGNAPAPQQPSVAQQMAISASQNAAASTAQGANSMANAGAAGAGSGIVPAVGVMAGVLGAGALTAGLTVAATNRGGLPPVVWQCDAAVEPVLQMGHVVLYIEGLDSTNWLTEPTQRQQLEESFAIIYNTVSGECDGTYQRILESATLNGNDWEQIENDVVRTNWTTSVWCNGACPDIEPLFYIRAEDYDTQAATLYGGEAVATASASSQGAAVPPTTTATARSAVLRVPKIGVGNDKDGATRARRELQQADQEAWFMLAFASNLSQAFTAAVFGGNSPAAAAGSQQDTVVVFDGYTVSPLDGDLIERIGSLDGGSPFSETNVTQDILDKMGAATNQRPVYDDVVPVCTETPSQTKETGNVHIMIENLDCALLQEGDNLSNLEDVFRAVFNRVGRGCDGLFQRVMQGAILVDCNTMTAVDATRGEVTYADTNWTSDVLCDGCRDPEPLFLRSYRSLLRRQLQEAEFLKTFVANMTKEMNDIMGNGVDVIDAFYGATMSTVDPNVVVEFTGQKIKGGVPVPVDESFRWENPKLQEGQEQNAQPGSGQEATNGEQPAAGTNNIFDQAETAENATNIVQEPVCATSDGEVFTYEEGRINLLIENVPADLISFEDTANLEKMEAAFKEAYNSVSGMCEGEFKRIVHSATLLDYSFEERGDGNPYVDTIWKADLSCSGCNPKEPLFLAATGNAVSNERSRQLQMDLSSLLGQFSKQFTADFNDAVKSIVLAEDPAAEGWNPLTVFYLATLSSDGTEVMQSTGYHPQFYINAGNGVLRPQRERPQGGKPNGTPGKPSDTAVDLNTTELMDACLKDLVLVDKNYNDLLDEQEYVRFFHKYVQQIFPDVDMHELQMDFPNFKKLPDVIQDNFNTFEAGGSIPIYGDKHQDGVPIEQEHFLTNFCNGTLDLIWFEFSATAAPQVARTFAPTMSPSVTTSSPTVITTAPSITPSTRPSQGEIGGGVQVTIPPVATTAPTGPPTTMYTAAPSGSSSLATSSPTGSSSAATSSPTGAKFATTAPSPTTSSSTGSPSSLSDTASPSTGTVTSSPSTAPPGTTAAPTSSTITSSPTTTATTVPTYIPITSAPIAKPPSASSPESSSVYPSAAPSSTTSASPTADNVLRLTYQIKLFIEFDGYTDREPTQEEYDGVYDGLQEYFFDMVADHYAGQAVLLEHKLTMLKAEYLPDPADRIDRYSHRLYFESDFIFDGFTPHIKELYQLYDNVSLQELTEKAVWSAEPLYGLFYATAGILWTSDVEPNELQGRSGTPQNVFSGIFQDGLSFTTREFTPERPGSGNVLP